MKTRVSIALFLAVALVALGVTIAVAQGRIALPGTESASVHTYDVTFTKWITEAPQMAGVVGGAVGDGTFEGQIQDMKVEGSMQYVEAIYHVNGSKQSFTAHIRAMQDNTLGSGVIIDSVTDGWLKGATLYGNYDVLTKCSIETPGNSLEELCFQGVLHLRPTDETGK